MGIQDTDTLSQLSLPPGFRFYPTDEELLVQYLCRKVAGHHFSLQIIGDVDLYKFDPWVLPGKAIFGEKEWYFFSPRDRKYPNGSRPNRVAGSGYWKATGTDKVITTEGRKVGIKKALVFYVGKAPKGTKTNWIMHEYRLSEPSRKNGSAKLDDWVLCRIYEKNSGGASKQLLSAAGVHSKEQSHGSSSSSSSQFDDMLETLPEIEDKVFSLNRMNSLRNLHQDGKINLQNLGSGSFDWATLAGLSSLPEFGHGQPQSSPAQQIHQAHGNVNANSNFSTVNNTHQNNEIYGLTFPQLCHVDEEVQSGNRTHRVNNNNNSALFHNALAQDYNHHHHHHNTLDPFGIRYPTQTGNVGFRQ